MTQYLDYILHFGANIESNMDFDEEEKSDSSPKFSLQTGAFVSGVVLAIALTIVCALRFAKKDEVSEYVNLIEHKYDCLLVLLYQWSIELNL